MSSKRDYVAAAKAIREESGFDPETRRKAAEILADTFARDNPRFDRERFLAACGLT